MRGALWVAGGVVSLLAHTGLAVLVMAAVRPGPPPAPTLSEPEFDIAAYPVPQNRADEQTADADAASESQPVGARAGGAAIPVRRATAAVAGGRAVAALAAEGMRAAPVDNPAVPLVAMQEAERLPTEPPDAMAMAPVEPVARPGAAAPLAAARVDTTAGAGTPLSPLAPEAGIATAEISPPAMAMAPVDPGTQPMLTAPLAAARLDETVRTDVAVVSNLPDAGVATAETAPATVAVTMAPDFNALTARESAPDLVAAGALTASPEAVSVVAPMATPARIATVALPSVASVTPAAKSARIAVPVQVGVAASSADSVTSALAGTALSARQTARIVPAAVRADGIAPASAPSPVLPAQGVPVSPGSAPAAPLDAVTGKAAAVASTPAGGGESLPIPLDAASVASVAPSAAPAPPLTPDSSRQTAALAWSGDAPVLDPVSLAAIQAFSRAGDPVADGPQVRDQIGALLAEVPCARLQTVFDPETGHLRVRGHLPEDGLRGPVMQALRVEVGQAIPVLDEVMILPRPQCGILAAIDAVGLPQSDDQEGDPRVVGDVPFAAVSEFSEGELLEFEVRGPDYPAYFYVDFFDAEGQVLHLQPNELVPPRVIDTREMQRVGFGADGKRAITITVSPPFGQEIMVAFASSVPLYDSIRPLVEPAGPYLEFLRDRIEVAKAGDQRDFRGEWFYFFVTTGPAP